MIDPKTENAKKREWQRQLRLGIVLENKFAKDVEVILKRQYRDAAWQVETYVMGTDQAIENHTKDLREVFKKNYIKIATAYSDDIVKDLQKSFAGYETKGLIEEFWQFMNIWILGNSAKQVTKVNNTTKKLISLIIAKSIDAGDTNQQTAKKIREVSAISTITRARTIARTETHTAAMKAINETMKATRIIKQKEWFSANDSRTRVKLFNHLAAHGERVGLNDYFQRTGEALEYPGDFIGSAGNIINCRCGVLHFTNIF